jgi:hypothetical protein
MPSPARRCYLASDILNATQAALLIGVSERTMRSWLKKEDMIVGAWKDAAPGGPAQWRIPRASLDGLEPLSRGSKGQDGLERSRLLDLERQIQELRERLDVPTDTLPRSRVKPLAARRDTGSATADNSDSHVSARASAEPEASAWTLGAAPMAPRDPSQATTRRINTTSRLPEGYVSWRQFANQHGIPESTIAHAIARGRLRVIKGMWKAPDINHPITAVLNQEGQRRFYQLYGSRPDFRPCTDCPHHPTPDVASIDAAHHGASAFGASTDTTPEPVIAGARK